MRKPIKLSGKILLWFLALVLVLVVLLELALVGAIGWLHAAGGQDWLRQQLATVTEESGYEIDFDRITYRFPHRLAIEGLDVGDHEGLFAEADEIIVRAGFMPLAARRLSLAVDAGTVILHRLPAEEEGERPAEDFTVPDLYFNMLSLNDLAIDRLVIKEEVAGVPLTFSPNIGARVTLGEVIGVSLEGDFEPEKDALPYLPEEVRFSGVLAPDGMLLTIDELALEASAYQLGASGTAGLEDRTVAIAFKGQAENTGRIVPALAGGVAFTGQIDGRFDSPVIQLSADPAFALLRDKGISDLTLELTARDLMATPRGTLRVQGQYQGQAISAMTDFVWQDSVMMLENLTAGAPDLSASGNLKVDTGAMLATGKVQLQSDNLTRYSEMTGVALKGAGTAILELLPQNGEQAIGINAVLQGVTYQDIRAADVKVTATLPSLTSPWPQQARFSVEDLQVNGDVFFKTLGARVTKKGEGAYELAVQGNGQVMQPFTLDGSATVAGLAQEQPAVTGMVLTLSSQDAAVTLTGAVNAEQAVLHLQTGDFALKALPFEVPGNFRNLFVRGTADITGPPSAPAGRYRLDLGPLALQGQDYHFIVEGEYRQGVLTANINGEGEGISKLGGTVRVPINFSLMPFELSPREGAELAGTIDLDADTEQLATTFLPPGHHFTGDIRAQAEIAGSLSDPQIGGTINIGEGTYHYEQYDILLNRLNLQAAIEPWQIRVTAFSATDREGGRLQGEGVFSLQNPEQTRLALQIEDFHPAGSDQIDGYMSADLALKGQPEGYLLEGDVAVGPLEVVIPEQFQRDIPELNVVRRFEVEQREDPLLQQVALDIAATVERAFVRGWGLDAELEGALDVTGTLDAPELDGVLQSVRGRYEEFGRRFEVEQANLRFQGRIPPSPFLDIRATTMIEEIAASVTLTGPLAEPVLGFSSIPELPDDEILARILFGQDMNSISPFQALQLKQTLDRFRGKGGGFDPLARIREATGLDDIRVEQGAEGGASVGVGKYLSDEVYLELESGAGEDAGGANLEIEVTPHITIESQIGQDAQAGAGVSWGWDY